MRYLACRRFAHTLSPKKSKILPLAVVLSVATLGAGTGVRADDNGLNCLQNETNLTMQIGPAAGGMPPQLDFLGAPPPRHPQTPSPDDGGYRLRLKLCLQGTNRARLTEITYQADAHQVRVVVRLVDNTSERTRTQEPGQFVYTLPPAFVDLTGLEEAILRDDVSRLHMMFALDHDTSLQIRGGWQGWQRIVTAVNGSMVSGGVFAPHSLAVLTGELRDGDPFAGDRCPPGQSFKAVAFPFERVMVTTESCTFQGAGQTTGFELIGLHLADDDPRVPASARRVHYTTPADLRAFVRYNWGHHNACDSIYIETSGGGIYAMTTRALAGCAAPVAGAPERSWEDRRSTVLFRIQREIDGVDQRGEAPGCHFVFPCLASPEPLDFTAG